MFDDFTARYIKINILVFLLLCFSCQFQSLTTFISSIFINIEIYCNLWSKLSEERINSRVSMIGGNLIIKKTQTTLISR